MREIYFNLFTSNQETRSPHDKLLVGMFDLEIESISFNFVEFLIGLELKSKHLNLGGFVINIVPRRDGSSKFEYGYDSIIDNSKKEWRIENLIIPLARLHPYCKGIQILPSRDSASIYLDCKHIFPKGYSLANPIQMDRADFYKEANDPKKITGLRATKASLEYIDKYISEKNITKNIVTITLRLYEYDKIRNSNLLEWKKFIGYLKKRGFHPIVIPDTEKAWGKEFADFKEEIFTDICWNMQLRLALSERAYMNLGVQNGPLTMMFFAPNCNVLQMNSPCDSKELVKKTKNYERVHHCKEGVQFGYLHKHQRMSFKPDNCEIIKAEFEAHERRIATKSPCEIANF